MVKVFLVEDESIIRRGIRDNIAWESHGFEFVGEAGDGEYAYPLLLNTKPDILITDIKMPFMDGLELSRLDEKKSSLKPGSSFSVVIMNLNMPKKPLRSGSVTTY